MATVAHVDVNCTDLDKSVTFYRNVGFTDVVGRTDSHTPRATRVLLRRPPSFPGETNPSLLLTQWRGLRPQPGGSRAIVDGHSPGVARMALWCADIIAEIGRLKAFGPISDTFLTEPVTDTPPGQKSTTTIVALRDPDGAMVELVEYGGLRKGKILPFFVHVNINVTRIAETGLPFYSSLGFRVSLDLGAVANSFYRTLCIADPGLARQVYLMKLPEEPSFQLDLIEWADPKTEGTAPLMSEKVKSPGIAGITLIVQGSKPLDGAGGATQAAEEALRAVAKAAGQESAAGSLVWDVMPGSQGTVVSVLRMTLTDPDGTETQVITPAPAPKL